MNAAGGQVDVVLAPIDREFADDLLRCRVAAEPDRTQAEQQQKRVLRVDPLLALPEVAECVSHQSADQHALNRRHDQRSTIGQQQARVPMQKNDPLVDDASQCDKRWLAGAL